MMYWSLLFLSFTSGFQSPHLLRSYVRPPSPASTYATSSTSLNIFPALTKSLQQAQESFSLGKKVTRLTPSNMSSSVKKIRRALLNADVNKQVVDGILEGIERRAVGEKVIEGVDPGQMFVKIGEFQMSVGHIQCFDEEYFWGDAHSFVAVCVHDALLHDLIDMM